MKNYTHYIILLLSIFWITGCSDPMTEIDSGDWNNERAILGINFVGQVGNSKITYGENNDGLITIMYNELGNNNSQIVIQNMELSFGATSDFKVGDALNMNNADHQSTITVTSQTGKKRVWTIKYTPFVDDLSGVWKVKKLSLYGGTYPNWGITKIFDDLTQRPWDWRNDGSGPIADYDNTLTFTLDGVNDEGNSFGKVVFDAGLDGKFADFFFTDQNKNIDVNYHYRKIQPGTSTWLRNFADGTITFTSGNQSTTCNFEGPGTQQLDTQDNSGDNNSITIEDKALMFTLPFLGVWDDALIYSDKDKIVDNPRKYWIQIKKL